MRLLVVVQRYGVEVFGGAEAHARMVATRLAAEGHEVEVVTSCAVSYVDWANVYPPGSAAEDGVIVHRLPVSAARKPSVFAPLHARALRELGRWPIYLQREWMRVQGPFLPALPDWLAENSAGFDCALFFTYLYYTTWAGLAAVRCPIVLQPTVHDEPPVHLTLFDGMFRMPDGFAFSTPEEHDLVARRFGITVPSAVIGIGVDLDANVSPSEIDAFRIRSGVGDRPYLVCVGRIEPGKGTPDLHTAFKRYKQAHPGSLALVLVGEELARLDEHPDVFKTGFVDDRTREVAMAGAEIFVNPSYFESFSMVLCEAWAAGRPALVQGACEVLQGHVARSGGGLAYQDSAQFQEALEGLLSEPALRRRVGELGRRYVEQNYPWRVVLDKYERLLAQIGSD